MTFIWEKNEKTSWRKWLSGFVLKKEQVLVLVFGIDNGKAAQGQRKEGLFHSLYISLQVGGVHPVFLLTPAIISWFKLFFILMIWGQNFLCQGGHCLDEIFSFFSQMKVMHTSQSFNNFFVFFLEPCTKFLGSKRKLLQGLKEQGYLRQGPKK